MNVIAEENSPMMDCYKSNERNNLYQQAFIRIRSSEDRTTTCDTVVMELLNEHRRYVREKGYVCDLDLDHEKLYICTKLIVQFVINNWRTILEVLLTIFTCEGHFDRIYLGALYGPHRTINNWTNIFTTHDDCLTALNRFAYFATKHRMRFLKKGTLFEFINLPLSDGQAPISEVYKAHKEGFKPVFTILKKYARESNSIDSAIRNGPWLSGEQTNDQDIYRFRIICIRNEN